MNITHNSKLTKYSQKLRKDLTDEERKLWYLFLKKLPIKTHRQKVIENYIVDFYIAKAKLIIEIDGSQHYEDNAIVLDKQRDKRLSELGYKVLRYNNNDINNKFESVCENIWQHIFPNDKF